MKRLNIIMMIVLLAVLMAGCGKENGKDLTGEDAGGNAVTLNGPSLATDEMNKENEAVRPEPEPEPEEPELVVIDPAQLNEPEIEQQEITEDLPEQPSEGRLQIVFLGDSILDGYRNETGIAYLTGINCNADVYNLAMGGTTAALSTYEKAEYDKWSSRGLQGVVHTICGAVGPGLLNGFQAREVYAACDFSQTDYFVIEYGLNDFLSGIPLNDEEDYFDEYTYVGALRIAVTKLRENFPNADIVLCSPNYAQFKNGDGTFLGDGNIVDNGGGTLAEYYRVCGNVAADMNTLFLNAYEGIGLDAYSADEYLEDGIHLSEKGRYKYARVLSDIILKYEMTKNN